MDEKIPDDNAKGKIFSAAEKTIAEVLRTHNVELLQTHLRELIAHDYVTITLAIGEWRWELIGRASHIRDYERLIKNVMKAGFHVAHDEEGEYHAHGGSPPGYG